MPVGWRFLRDAPRCSSSNPHNVHEGTMLLLRVIADGKLRGVRRNAVIIVAAVREAGIDNFWLAATHRRALDVAVAVEKECAAIAHPVRCLETSRRKIRHPPVGRIDRDRLERAVKRRLSRL